MDEKAVQKYKPYPWTPLADRTWPDKSIGKAPRWCSVDLRDGNQALITPMNMEEKLEMFNLLLEVGFKEIETGFPSASQVEFDFTRKLIEDNLIPDGVVIQMLTQARKHLIEKTFSSFAGAREVIVHLYNSTSTLQREVVFKKSRAEIIDLGVAGAKLVKDFALDCDTRVGYEYSPESFTGTEMEFALEICQAIMDVFEPTPQHPVILNLPATVEMATPNIYADQIEWFCRNLPSRDCAVISVHAHNDRGTAVAATELALMAGADRVEGTLFGNGERTGNVDILTLALNMFSQGVNPELDFSNIDRIINVYQRCCRLSVHPRHPYAGELVYTAFSGSHQDAISKGMATLKEDGLWAVPYLPIDPRDVGRSYESIIRINSQSGKGGASYIMDKEFGFRLPREMQAGFGRVVKEESERVGKELSWQEIFAVFEREYLLNEGCYKLKKFQVLKRHVDQDAENSIAEVESVLLHRDKEVTVKGLGNGPLDAFCNALKEKIDFDFSLHAYHEHALTRGSSSKAVTYIEIITDSNEAWWGAGLDTDIIICSVKALLSALNRYSIFYKKGGLK